MANKYVPINGQVYSTAVDGKAVSVSKVYDDGNNQFLNETLEGLDNGKVDKETGKGLSTNDYTSAEKTKLAGIATGAEVNQNAFSTVKVGNTNIQADSKTDMLTLIAGDNVTLTPNATNDSIEISAIRGGGPVDAYTKSQSDARYVQQEAGKGLSTNDFTDWEKEQVENVSNRAYASGKDSGMGKLYLKRNKSLSSQMTQANTTYVVQDDLKIGGGSVLLNSADSMTVGGVTYFYAEVILANGEQLSVSNGVKIFVQNSGYQWIDQGTSYTSTQNNQVTRVAVISYTDSKIDYTIAGETSVTIPANCVLEFDGGSISDGTLVLNNTLLEGEVKLSGVTLSGTSKNDCLYNTWFGIMPNDTSSNNDTKWQSFLTAASSLGATAFIVNGEYSVFSGFELSSDTSICGDKNHPVIYYKGASTANDNVVYVFTCKGLRISISNLTLERDEQHKYEAGGIKIGDRTTNTYCTFSSFESITCSCFKYGINFEYCWNNAATDIRVTWNEIGILHKVTECHITHLVAEGNVVGVATEKLGNYDTANLRIIQGTIEGNGMGCLLPVGDCSFYNIYFEGNVPNASNRGTSFHYSDNYEHGGEIVCGCGEDWCTSLTIEDCYVGHSDSRYDSLFKVDKCNCLNVKGTHLCNLVTTTNTSVSNVDSITQKLLRGVSYATSMLNASSTTVPCFFREDFKASDVQDVSSRFVVGCGIAIANQKRKYSDGKIKLYTETQDGQEGKSCTVYLEGNYIQPGDYTVYIKIKRTQTVNIIETYDNYSTHRDRYEFLAYSNKDLSLLLPMKVTVSAQSEYNSGYTQFKWFNNTYVDGGAVSPEYVPNDEDNGLVVEGVYMYKGVPCKLDNTLLDTRIHRKIPITDVTKALAIPSTSPSAHSFDAYGIMEGRPTLYFSTSDNRIKVKYNGITYSLMPELSGSTRPTGVMAGAMFLETSLGGTKPIWYNGSKWVDYYGNDANVIRAGLITARPALNNIVEGFSYLCSAQFTIDTTDYPAGLYSYIASSSSWITPTGERIADTDLPTRA